MAGTEHLTLLEPCTYTPLQASPDAFLLSKQAARCTPKTLVHHPYTVGSFVEFMPKKQITTADQIAPDHIRRFLVDLQGRRLKDPTQQAHARGIKTWVRWLACEGDLEESPMKWIDVPKLEQRILPPFSPDHIRQLLAGCDRRTDSGRRNYAIILCLLDSGLRLVEFASLRLADVDLRNGIVTLRRGKGGRQRQTRFGAKARRALVRFLSDQDRELDQPLWGVTPRGLQIMLRRLGRKAGAEPRGAHRFRGSSALWCLRDGMDLHSLRMHMGCGTTTHKAHTQGNHNCFRHEPLQPKVFAQLGKHPRGEKVFTVEVADIGQLRLAEHGGINRSKHCIILPGDCISSAPLLGGHAEARRLYSR